jgi:predicted Zn-dependent protease
MRSINLGYIVSLIFLLLLSIGCTKAPITNRYQMILTDSSKEIAKGLRYSKIILKRSKISKNKILNRMIQKVGKQISKVVNLEYGTIDYQWRFYLIENMEKENAFCFSGGQVFVYTGLFKYIENRDELAIVMGHEIAHALARHGAERKTSSKFSEAGNRILNFFDTYQKKSIPIERKWNRKQNKKMIDEWIILPHSRTQEYEADKIGLILSSKAGYNPKASISFWKKFTKNSKQNSDYKSTHPSSINRIEELKKIIPFAESFYKK